MYKVLLWSVAIFATSTCISAIAGVFIRYGYGPDDQDSQEDS